MSRGGRTHGRARLPVESCHSLSAWGYFQRAQMWTQDEDDLDFSWDGDDRRAVIRFTRNGIKRMEEIALTFTPCNYGGVRAWFVCPSCKRRVGKVYLPCTMYMRGVRVWLWWCRHCYGLTYEQRRERDRYWTLLHRADRIAERWLGEMSKDWIGKRKGQHRRTFERRADEYEKAIGRSNGYMIASLEGLTPRLGLLSPKAGKHFH